MFMAYDKFLDTCDSTKVLIQSQRCGIIFKICGVQIDRVISFLNFSGLTQL